jgi:DNA mismatch repair protein MutL
MEIAVLTDKTASQIAAGEVVERPVSVVKELIENSLDASASQIIIRIEASGRRLIEISDDGDGIPSDEIHLAVARHATSKLRDAEELSHIQTLGFRGEALASIASVSRFSITSRVLTSLEGVCLEAEGGKITRTIPASSANGTMVRVEDLFFNLPARLKFLKQEKTERQAIDTLVMRYAAAYPEVGFQLFNDGKITFKTNGGGNRKEVMVELFGLATTRQLIEIELEETGYSITGFSSPISLTRSNRKEITFFINGRWVMDATLNTALIQAYHTFLMIGRYPLAALFLEIPPEELDVNVHPAKAEVRFRFPDRIFSLVQRAVRRALLTQSPVPQFTGSKWQPYRRPLDPLTSLIPSTDVNSSGEQNQAILGSIQSDFVNDFQQSITFGGLPLLRLIGQIGAAYIVAEGPDGLYLIDQHAAHERVLFERFRRQHQSNLPSQTLLEGVVLQLSAGKYESFLENLDAIRHIGFDIEPFGADAFLIRSIPAIISNIDPVAAVQVVIEDFEEDETPLKGAIEDRLIARICKRAAVKAGKTLTAEEQSTLLRDLEGCESPRTCPHGRPTMIHLSVDLLERQFGRRGSR